MIEIIEILRQEHRDIKKLLCLMEQELTVFDRGERPDYDIFGAIIEYFKKYLDTCHHPKEDIIYEKFRMLDPSRAASVADLQAEHREGQCGCAGSLGFSTVYSMIKMYYVQVSIALCATLSTMKESTLLWRRK